MILINTIKEIFVGTIFKPVLASFFDLNISFLDSCLAIRKTTTF